MPINLTSLPPNFANCPNNAAWLRSDLTQLDGDADDVITESEAREAGISPENFARAEDLYNRYVAIYNNLERPCVIADHQEELNAIDNELRTLLSLRYGRMSLALDLAPFVGPSVTFGELNVSTYIPPLSEFGETSVDLAGNEGGQEMSFIRDFLATDRSHIRFNPEYLQRHFYVLVPSPEGYGWECGDDPEQCQTLLDERAQISNAILQASPETIFSVFVPREEMLETIRENYLRQGGNLRDFYQAGRLDFRVGGYAGDAWAQDIGEIAHREVETVTGYPAEFILGMPLTRVVGRHRSAPFLQSQINIPVTTIPILFEGGDITTTTLNEENVVVAGPAVIDFTREFYRDNYHYQVTREEITAVLLHAFAADRVILLDNPVEEMAPNFAFHIDQAFFFPRDGLAIMIDPDSITTEGSLYYANGRAELRKALVSYRQQLQQAGFRIIEIPTNNYHVDHFQSYTNSITITRSDGGITIIMPGFVGHGSRSLQRQIRGIMEGEGINVVFVRNHSWRGQGNTHCLTGALQ